MNESQTVQSPVEVVVGRSYLVPVVTSPKEVMSDPRNGTVPVFGPLHADPDLVDWGNDWRHLHIDWRFVSPRVFQIARERLEDQSRNGFYSIVVWEDISKRDGLDVFMARRKCHRQWEECGSFPAVQATKWVNFEQRFARARLDPQTMLCPHRGMCLRGLPVDDDVVTCPGHGLRWNVKTGQMVPHHSATNTTTTPRSESSVCRLKAI